jgi:uncharacterized protein YndB with AHSA1/START domain
VSTSEGMPISTSSEPLLGGDRHTVEAVTYVATSAECVWAVLLHPGARWMLGANIETDLKIGSPVTFEGHFFGRQFEDHGVVLDVQRARLLRFTHFSPSYGLPDVPENYHDITITLSPAIGGTLVEIVHRNILTEDRAERASFQWKQALATIAHSDPQYAERQRIRRRA